VQFVATGGMHAGNAREFLDAGVRAVAVGSAFADPDQISRLASLGT
jgi:2-dehydro-3-deoxyphosphogluconate aldolase/(4S)-4-hydroxy-2-oxoglutarate aldolase